MLKNLWNKTKSCAKSVATKVAIAGVSLIGVASAQQAEIKAAMEAIKTDATANAGTMTPLGIAIIGVIVAATITLAIFKKITGKVG